MNFLQSPFFKKSWPYLLLLTIGVLFYTFYVGVSFVPLHGSGDMGGWEYSGYYIFENLQWIPFPWLPFDNNLHFYPEGISPVFMSWGLERDLFFALMYKLFGHGGWLFLYFALSHVLLSVLVFALCHKRLGWKKALFLAIVPTYFNIYSLNKFPGHYGLSIHHWTSLAIILDFLILKQFHNKETPDLTLIIWRVFATIGTLGLDLGYVGGLAFTSAVATLFYLHTFYIGYGLIYRTAYIGISEIKNTWLRQLRLNLWQKVTLICTLVAYTSLIFPTFLSMFLEVKAQQTPEILAGAWFTSPERIFAPLIEPYYTQYVSQFKDNPEGYGAGSVGWFFLISGTIGLFFAIRKKYLPIFPILLFFISVLHFNPEYPSPLKYLPWNSYARVGPRLGMIFPLLLSIMAIAVPWTWKATQAKSSWKAATSWALLALLLLIESKMILGPRLTRPYKIQGPSEVYLQHMDAIKKEPGEAVFDFPFCYKGGNGGGHCPHENLSSVWSNRKYHGKKVLGTYFGRLPHKYNQFYTKYGLHQMMQNQSLGCLSEQETTLLKGLFHEYDFCCMNVYVDVFRKECRATYEKVFGKPQKVSKLENFGTTYLYTKSGMNKKNPESIKVSWSVYQLFESTQELNDIYRIKQFYLPKEVDDRLKTLKKFSNLDFKPYEDFDGFLTNLKNNKDQTKFFLVSTMEIKKPGFFFVDKLIDYYIYFRGKEFIADTSRQGSFFARAKKARISGQIDFKLSKEEKEIYLHPSHVPADMVFDEIELSPEDKLAFGVRLANPLGTARFKIYLDDRLIFEKFIKGKKDFSNIFVSLNKHVKEPGKKHKIKFSIDPAGTTNFTWTSWINPRVAYHR